MSMAVDIRRIIRLAIFGLCAFTHPVHGQEVMPPPSNIPAVVDQDQTISAYQLGSGDKVRLRVYNEETLSGEYEVDGTGSLSVPLIGAVPVAGKSVQEVITAITSALRSGGFMLNPSVSMEVLLYRPFYVLGEVKQPGRYPYVSNMSALNAVALAGGFTYRANRRKVSISRAGNSSGKERKVLVTEPIMPGDVIRVGQRIF